MGTLRSLREGADVKLRLQGSTPDPQSDWGKNHMGEMIKQTASKKWAVKSLLVLGILLCWLGNTYGQLVKYLHNPFRALGASLVCCAGLCLCMILAERIDRPTARRSSQPRLKLFVGYVLMASVISGTVYFRSVSGKSRSTAGSDRRSALEEPIKAALLGHSPYARTTKLGSPITPMPGALLLALPFVEVGATSLQNLLWLGIFAWIIIDISPSNYFAVLSLTLLIPLSGLLLSDFGVGGDYVVNVFYVLALAVEAYRRSVERHAAWKRALTYILFGISLSSRPVYFVTPVVIAGFVRSRSGNRAAWRLLVITGSTALLITGSVFFWDPTHFSPFHTVDFLQHCPRWLHARIVLPIVSFLMSVASFWLRPSEMNVLLLMGLSLTVIIVPPELFNLLAAHFADTQATHEMAYVCPATIPLTVWLCSMLSGSRSRAAFKEAI